MMNVSSEFKNLVKNGAKIVNYADITLKDGTVLNLGPSDFAVGGFNMTDKTTDGKFGIGFAVGKTINMTIANHTNKFSAYDFYKSIIYLYVAIELSDGRVLKERTGKYYVLNPATPGDTIKLSGVDSMCQFDKPFEADIQFPATLQTILSQCCTDCGVNIGFTEFDNWNFVVYERPEECTYRQVVSWSAQIAGYNARINNNDALDLVWYASDEEQEENTIDGGNFFLYELEDTIDGGDFTNYEAEITIDGGTFTDGLTENVTKIANLSVSTDDVVITGVKVEYDGVSVLRGIEGYVINVKNNPLVAGVEEAVTDYLFKRIAGMSFRPLTCKTTNNPLFEPFDNCYVYDRKGNAYFTLINNVSYSVSGFTTIACNAADPVRNESSYTSEAAMALVEARRNTKKEITLYDKAVQNMNMLAANSMGLYRESETQSDGSVIYYMSNRPIYKNEEGVCEFEFDSVVYKMTADGFFVSEDGGITYTSGFDAEGNAVVNVLSAIGITFDWARGGTLTLGGFDNQDGQINILNSEGEAVGVINNNGIAIFSPTTQLQTLISPNVGFVLRDAEGNEFYGMSYDKTVNLQPYISSQKPYYSYSDGNPYNGYSEQPVKRVCEYSMKDVDKLNGYKTGNKKGGTEITPGVVMYQDEEWYIYMEHSETLYNVQGLWIPSGINSKKITNSDGTTSYGYECEKTEIVIQLPESFKEKNIAVNVIQSFDYDIYKNSDDKIFQYEYRNMTIPSCTEGSNHTEYYSWFASLDNFIIFPYDKLVYKVPSPYFPEEDILENVPDSIREVYSYNFNFPEIYDYDYSYVVDNENATVTITGWAVGRTSNLYNNTQLDFYRDFINMNEFMKFRVMATC